MWLVHPTEDYGISLLIHYDVIKWKHFPCYWPFVWGIHRSTVNFPHKGQWRGALMFSLICAWINDWVNTREAGDSRRRRAHYDVIVMPCPDHRYACSTNGTRFSLQPNRHSCSYSILWNRWLTFAKYFKMDFRTFFYFVAVLSLNWDFEWHQTNIRAVMNSRWNVSCKQFDVIGPFNYKMLFYQLKKSNSGDTMIFLPSYLY